MSFREPPRCEHRTLGWWHYRGADARDAVDAARAGGADPLHGVDRRPSFASCRIPGPAVRQDGARGASRGLSWHICYLVRKADELELRCGRKFLAIRLGVVTCAAPIKS